MEPTRCQTDWNSAGGVIIRPALPAVVDAVASLQEGYQIHLDCRTSRSGAVPDNQLILMLP